MFNNSLKEAVEKYRKCAFKDIVAEDEHIAAALESELQKKLSQEEKENYEGWKNDPITQKVFSNLKEEVERNNLKLLQHCLGTGLDRPVEERKVLYYSLKNRVIGELLKFLKR